MKTWTKSIVTGLLTAAVILSSLPAIAGPYGPYSNRRELNEQHRIYQGLRSGRLSPGEFRHLEHQQRHIRLAEARMRADGHLNGYERARLNRMENRAGHNIYRDNHNNWRPGWH